MKKTLLTLCLCLSLLLVLPLAAYASEANASVQSENAVQESGFFLLLYDRIASHLPEIFSALSLLGAAIIGFTYKRGLLPALRDGIGSIGEATKEWGRSAENHTKNIEEICENVNNSIHFIEDFAKKTSASLKNCEEKISMLDDQKKENEKLGILMNAQVDLLLDVFLSSSLPQFEKERVCKRAEEMKAALAVMQSGGEGNAEE